MSVSACHTAVSEKVKSNLVLSGGPVRGLCLCTVLPAHSQLRLSHFFPPVYCVCFSLFIVTQLFHLVTEALARAVFMLGLSPSLHGD